MTGFKHRSDTPPLRAAALMLLIAAVMVCLALLAALCLTTAQADLRLAEKQLRTVQENGLAEALGAQWLTDTAETLTTGEEAAADLAVGTDSVLHIAARADADGLTVTCWQLEKQWMPQDTDTLWDGN